MNPLKSIIALDTLFVAIQPVNLILIIGFISNNRFNSLLLFLMDMTILTGANGLSSSDRLSEPKDCYRFRYSYMVPLEF